MVWCHRGNHYFTLLWVPYTRSRVFDLHERCQVVSRNMREIMGGSKNKGVQFVNMIPGGSTIVIQISTADSTSHIGKHPYVDKYFIMYAVSFFFIRNEIFPIVLKQVR